MEQPQQQPAAPVARLDQPAPPELREQINGLIAEVGETRARALLGVSRSALMRALAGLPCRRGTVVALGASLAAARTSATPADLLTVEDVVAARGNGRPLGEVADSRARSLDHGGNKR
jgi:hypothetical protein